MFGNGIIRTKTLSSKQNREITNITNIQREHTVTELAGDHTGQK